METALHFYAWAFGVFTVGSALIKLGLKLGGRYEQVPAAIQIEELLTIPILLLGVLGMAGYLLDAAFLDQRFWQVYVGLMLVHTLAGFWLPKLSAVREQLTTGKFVILNVAAFLIGAPMYAMVIAYAFFTFPVAAGAA